MAYEIRCKHCEVPLYTREVDTFDVCPNCGMDMMDLKAEPDDFERSRLINQLENLTEDYKKTLEITLVDKVVEMLKGIALSDESYSRIRDVLDATIFDNRKVTKEAADEYLKQFNEFFGNNSEPDEVEFIKKKEMVV